MRLRPPLAPMRFPAIALIALVMASVPMAAQTSPTQDAGSVRIVVRDPVSLPILGAEVTLIALPQGNHSGSTASDANMMVATDNRGRGALRGDQAWQIFKSSNVARLQPVRNRRVLDSGRPACYA